MQQLHRPQSAFTGLTRKSVTDDPDPDEESPRICFIVHSSGWRTHVLPQFLQNEAVAAFVETFMVVSLCVQPVVEEIKQFCILFDDFCSELKTFLKVDPLC